MDTNKMRDLKALAEAATQGQWMTDGEYVNEHGNVLFAYVAHENSGRIAEAFVNCLVKTTEQCRANAAFIAAANPSTVLGLLAKIECLEAQVRLAGVAAEVTVQQEVGRAVTRELALAQECDQPKTENEALRDGANFRAIQSLRADCEALRRDAARYRWLRDQCGLVEYKAIAGSIGPGMLPCGEELQVAIDAAMAKEVKPCV